jgi:urea transporter
MDIWLIVSIPLWIAAAFFAMGSLIKFLSALSQQADYKTIDARLFAFVKYLVLCFAAAYIAAKTMGA